MISVTKMPPSLLPRSDFAVAAQNCWVKAGGAYTGEVSAEMLARFFI